MKYLILLFLFGCGINDYQNNCMEVIYESCLLGYYGGLLKYSKTGIISENFEQDGKDFCQKYRRGELREESI